MPPILTEMGHFNIITSGSLPEVTDLKEPIDGVDNDDRNQRFPFAPQSLPASPLL
jgi:hypothetical protein